MTKYKNNILSKNNIFNLPVVVTITTDNPKSVYKWDGKYCLVFIIYSIGTYKSKKKIFGTQLV